MFTTISPDGSVNSRPMVVQDFDFDGDLWFFTYKSSSKVEAICEDSHVCIAFMDPTSNRYVSVTGTAEVLRDPWTLKKMWSESFERWFPEGPHNPDLALIRVRVSHADAWDAPHSETVETINLSAPSYRRTKGRAQVVRSQHH
jgi:general stress protein 26